MILRHKKVLVTGADGFIGSHLVERLVKEGCQVRAFVYYNAFNSWGWIDTLPAKIKKEIEVIVGDIRDPHGVRQSMEKVEVVFHLAALIGIPFSYHSPDCYVDTNVKGTLNVLQAARDLGTKRVLVTSTSEVYGTARYVPIDEKHPRQGQSPYSATKIAADAMADSFYRSFDLPVVTVRPFNTYGPRQSARAFIPTVITQLLSGTKDVRLGDLTPRRDLVYVADTVEAFLALARAKGVEGKEVNIATGKDYSVGDIAQKLGGMIAPGMKIVRDGARVRPQKSEVRRLCGDARLIKELSGWTPAYNIDAGLQATVAWFRDAENLKGYKAEIYNV